MAIFQASSHLVAWRLGAWPVRLVGTQPEMSLGLAINSFLSFAAQLPSEPTGPLEPPGSFGRESAMEDGAPVFQGARKRRRPIARPHSFSAL